MDPVTLLYQVIFLIVSAALSYYLAPTPPKPAPGKLSNMPIADQGAPVGLLMGRRVIKQPGCVWWGDVRTTPIKVKAGK